MSDTHPRYIVATQDRSDFSVDYLVVDTDLNGNDDGAVLVTTTASAAHLIADSLNGKAEAELELARAALIELHAQRHNLLDRDATEGTEWGEFHKSPEVAAYVERLQREWEVPF